MAPTNSRPSQSTNHRKERSQRSGGFTLVEVAIALVIFVFGALAVIRIFPPAFNLIQNSGSRAVATHLSRSALQSFTTDPLSVPDAVCSAVPNPGAVPVTYAWTDFPYSTVGSASKNSSLPANPQLVDVDTPQSAKSAFDAYRYIVGERHIVQEDSNGNSFVILQYPYGDSTVTVPYLNVWTEDTVNGVQVSSANVAAGALDFTHATLASTGAAFNDPTSPTQPLQTNLTTTKFYLTYSWTETTNGPINKVIDEPLVYPVSPSVPKVLEAYRGSVTVVPGQIGVRIRQQVSATTADDLQNVGLVNLGLAGTAGVPQPGTMVSVDYLVSDWRWLVDDSPLTEQASDGIANHFVLNLPVRHIDYSAGPWLYTLVTGTNSGGNVDLLNGPANSGTQAAPIVTPTPPATFDFKDAQLTLDASHLATDANGPFGAPRARTVYQSLDGWGSQISVAARSYVPFYDASQFTSGSPDSSQTSEPWRGYVWNGLDPNYLYFHVSEAGKTVLVTYQDSSQSQPLTGMVTISQDTIGIPASSIVPASFIQTATNTQGLVANAQILTPDGSNVVAILGVQGVSTQARTAFIDNNHYTDVSVMGYRPPPGQ